MLLRIMYPHLMKKVTLLIFGFMVFPVSAADDGRTAWSVQWENDLFGEYTDRHYTNGIRVSATHKIDKKVDKSTLDQEFRDMAKLIPGMNDACAEETDWLFNVNVGQNMYTPVNLRSSSLLTNDRPYAGWAYVNFGLLAERERSSHPDAACQRRFHLFPASTDTIDTLELSLGIIGPDARAEGTQRWFHENFDGVAPQGWDHQLHNEPAINLTFSRQSSWGGRSDNFDVVTHWGGALGNVFTYANTGATVRFGHGLTNDYGPPRIRPGIPGSDFIKPNQGDKYSLYVFAGIEGRAIARNIFLDGNTFRDSHSVDKYPFVGDAQAGIVFRMGHLRLSYTSTYRSKEFSGQSEPSQFGAITLTASVPF